MSRSLMRFLPTRLRTLMRQRWERGRGGSERQAGQKREKNRFKLERASLAWPVSSKGKTGEGGMRKRGLSCNGGMMHLALVAAHLF